MMIPVILSARGIFLTSIIVAALAVFVIVNSSKNKQEYQKSTGTVTYFDKKYKDYPNRDYDSYRYLAVDGYPCVFEIYEPNSEKTPKTIDDLKPGDTIDIYYYEIGETRSIGINRFAQFIDKDGQPYFIRSGFQKQLGYFLIVICILADIVAVILWKKGKLPW